MKLSLTTYLLDLIVGPDGFTPGSGDLISLLDGGPLRIVIVAVDDAVIGPQRARLVHPDILRVHFHRELRNKLPISMRSRC